MHLAYLRFPGRVPGADEAPLADVLAFIAAQIGCDDDAFPRDSMHGLSFNLSSPVSDELRFERGDARIRRGCARAGVSECVLKIDHRTR